MRGTDARSRKRDKPKGVVHCFHVSLYKIEPGIDSRNLFAKYQLRASLADEVE
jgi:hypothetical protein